MTNVIYQYRYPSFRIYIFNNFMEMSSTCVKKNWAWVGSPVSPLQWPLQVLRRYINYWKVCNPPFHTQIKNSKKSTFAKKVPCESRLFQKSRSEEVNIDFFDSRFSKKSLPLEKVPTPFVFWIFEYKLRRCRQKSKIF